MGGHAIGGKLCWACLGSCLVVAAWASPVHAAIERTYGPELTASVGPKGKLRGGIQGRLVIERGNQGLLRFRLPPLVRPLAVAKLRVYVTGGNGEGLTVRRARGGWGRRGVHWWSRPRPVGWPLSSWGAVAPKGQWLEFDVTAAIHRSGGRHGFVLTTRSPGRLALGARRSAPAPLRPQLQLWLDAPPWNLAPGPTPQAGDVGSDAARHELTDVLRNVRGATGYRYGATDDKGNRLDTLKIIQTGPRRYIGVYHAFLRRRFQVMLASSTDLLHWRYRVVLGRHASQPTIATLGGRGFLVAYESASKVGASLRFRYYPSLRRLLAGRYAREFTAPSTLSRAAEGTPNIYGVSLRRGISDSEIRVGLHYFRSQQVDRQATGTLRDFSSWKTRTQPQLDNRPLALGVRGNIGDRDHTTFAGYDFNVQEAQLLPRDWSAWRTYLYDFRTRAAYWLDIQTHRGSRSFGNPTVTEVTSPSGKRALVMTLFLFHEGAAPGEAGSLIYYRELPLGPKPPRG
jgi:hypothetical protein